MRNLINLTKVESEELNDQFSDLLELLNHEKLESFNMISLSPFDHWLKEGKEFSEHIGNVSDEQATLNDLKLHNFIISLGNITQLISVKLVGRKKEQLKFRRFTSSNALKRKTKLKSHLSSNLGRLTLLIPEMELIYLENWDFTHHIFSKSKPNNTVIEKLAKENGLYLI